ncbi:zinc-dependent alcohol dehydrogenase family protein [Synechococcus sp. PCC 6312]|uniref:zinc-dependent alcohol dehydrogenase family protein n=1 Tax=Synechococcus sp. (strain ATCC 27167 / PCC 6312) TaxID=195253 RepID=UPI00029EC404|nr:zinc-dependent alcohol dehydrogenase family protein [Synechococcus sp. PCC 6312]AFY61153.1 Zn-dependent oxidoreductase, NADPH:quinone reductase [Synechococcus sp. PCC 6312]
MKAVLLRQPGPASALELSEIPRPQLESPDEVLVKLKAAGVNPIDTKLRQRGTFYPELMPAILGCDGAGVIAEVGSEVTQWCVGDEVLFCQGGLGKRPGTYAEYAVVPSHCLARKPQPLSFTQAAALPLVTITAWEALYDRAQLQPGQRILIHAGAGGVGHIAIQLAKLSRAEVATTVSSPAKAEFVKQLGAELVLNYREFGWEEELQAWTGGKGVDVGFDTVGGTTLTETFSMVKPYGQVVTLLEPSPETNWKVARRRNLKVSFTMMLAPELDDLREAQIHQAQLLQQAIGWVFSGYLQIEVAKTFPLAAAADAHRYLESGQGLGKIVLVI